MMDNVAQDDPQIRWLFLDLKSYFASVEQQINPKLRGRPVAIVPIMAESGCCIAASREAKVRGIKTGTGVAEARRLCPGIQIVEARPQRYVEYHHAIVAAVESCIPVTAIHSIDEMACRLTGPQRELDCATELARRIKTTIRRNVGEALTCSIGLAPNRLLAKVACDMQKPDGLTAIRSVDLPSILYSLAPIDIPGIGPRMNRRLEARGITTVQRLCELTRKDMKRLWGGITGERFWYWLHGHDIPDIVTHQSSIGHSHVLPPELRTEAGAYAVLQKLVAKAALRLRQQHLWCTRLFVMVKCFNKRSWEAKIDFAECRDTLTLLEALARLWEERSAGPAHNPFIVAVNLLGLIPGEQHNLSIFEDKRRLALADTMDRVNAKYGRATLYPAALHTVRSAAPTRISFQTIPDSCEWA